MNSRKPATVPSRSGGQHTPPQAFRPAFDHLLVERPQLLMFVILHLARVHDAHVETIERRALQTHDPCEGPLQVRDVVEVLLRRITQVPRVRGWDAASSTQPAAEIERAEFQVEGEVLQAWEEAVWGRFFSLWVFGPVPGSAGGEQSHV